jgi:DNA-binding transcriptional regulator YhcF (GntR family)
MRKSGNRWWLKNEHQLNAFCEWIRGEWEKGKQPTMQELAQERSTNQNTMMHALYRDIASQTEDQSLVEVKRICKLHYGVAIKKASDREWAEFYDRAIKPLAYEDKLEVIGAMSITSDFTKKMATEYLDTIISEYTKKGFALADPRHT